MATFSGSIGSITESSARLTCRFSGGDSGFAFYRFIEVYIDGRYYDRADSTAAGGSSSTFYMTISGLDPDTTYDWEAVLGYYTPNSETTTSYSDSGSFTTDSAELYEIPSFTIQDIGPDYVSVAIDVSPDFAYYRVLCRLASDSSDKTYDRFHALSRDTTITVDGLSPDTNYVVNVGYDNDGANNVDWLTSRPFTTLEALGDLTRASVRIYTGSGWVSATPYIYMDQNGWQPYAACIKEA